MPSRSQIPKNKVQINAVININTYEQLRRLAVMIYGGRKGSYSKIIEDAIAHYAKSINEVQNPMKTPKIPSVEQAWQGIIEYIKRRRNDPLPPEEIHERELIEAIAATRGSDKRTLMKWLNTLQELKYIEYIAGTAPRRVFKVKRK
jgi:hypothetical protein